MQENKSTAVTQLSDLSEGLMTGRAKVLTTWKVPNMRMTRSDLVSVQQKVP